jgi:hypothetical protein
VSLQDGLLKIFYTMIIFVSPRTHLCMSIFVRVFPFFSCQLSGSWWIMSAISISVHVSNRVANEVAVCALSVADCCEFWHLHLLLRAVGPPPVWMRRV